MTEVKKTIKLDLSRKSDTRMVFTKQNDCGSRLLHIILTDNGKKFTVPDSAVASLNVLRPDQQSAAFAASITADGEIEITLGAWVLALCGEVKCNVSLYFEGDKRLSTSNFILSVEDELYSGNEITEDENYTLLTSLISDCSAIMYAESLRVGAEEARRESELNRKNAELQRSNNELFRQSDETVRNNGENYRKQNEEIRKANEIERIANEEVRQQYEYSLPCATPNTLGGIKVGNGLSIDEFGIHSLALSSAEGGSF